MRLGWNDADHLAVRPDPFSVEAEDLLHADHVFFHAGDLGDVDHFAGAVAHARDLHDDRDGRGDLLANRSFRQIQVGHGDHRFQPGQRVARSVGVDRGHRAFVAGVHGLQHVEGFFAANLADDDAVGAHTQAVDQQLPLADRALPFDVGRPGLQAHDVFLRELQFGRVFDGDQALVLRNVLRQDVQERRLAGAGAAGDQDADARAHRRGQHFHHLRAKCSSARPADSAASGPVPKRRMESARPIERQRRNDRVDARAVGQAGIDHGRGFVHPAADARNDAVDDLQQMAIVAERRIDLLAAGRRVR